MMRRGVIFRYSIGPPGTVHRRAECRHCLAGVAWAPVEAPDSGRALAGLTGRDGDFGMGADGVEASLLNPVRTLRAALGKLRRVALTLNAAWGTSPEAALTLKATFGTSPEAALTLNATSVPPPRLR